MKEIRTIKMVEVADIKFVAEDGKEFRGENAEFECKAYERQCNKDMVKKAFERLNAKEIDISVVSYFNNEAEFWKITLESKHDYYTMTDYFEVIKECYDNFVEMPKNFPCTMVVVKGYDYIDEYRYNLKAELQNALDQLG